jgi:large repetitive protein
MRTLLFTAVGLAAGAIAAGTASAQTVSCGQVVTQSIRLSNDLVDCPGDGLVVAADGVTVNLNGHTIDGPGGPPPYDFGVRIDGSHRGVTVRNGTIKEFYAGVSLGAGNRAVRLRGANGFYGVLSQGNNTVAFNRISGGVAAIIPGANDRIASNDLMGSAISSLGQTDGTEIVRNRDGYLIAVGVPTGFPVLRNRVAHNSLQGIAVTHGSEWIIERNVVRGGSIRVSGVANQVRRNVIRDSPFSGLSVESGQPGAGFGNSRDNVVVRNDVARSAFDGIFVEGSNGCPSPGSCRPGAMNTLLRDNTTRRNGDDGIETASPTTTLAGNVANSNGDLGIEAVSGVVDGGGNAARGNGNPLQCTNVLCR